MLTKSLHTVTAVTKVAMYVKANLDVKYPEGVRSAADLVQMALGILGYQLYDVATASDPTVQACVKAVAKAMQS